jgi:hypothetical protein
MAKKAKRAPSSAPVVAARAPHEATLDSAQRRLLAEALRRAAETRDVMEDALVAFGRRVLFYVFTARAVARVVEAIDQGAVDPGHAAPA